MSKLGKRERKELRLRNKKNKESRDAGLLFIFLTQIPTIYYWILGVIILIALL